MGLCWYFRKVCVFSIAVVVMKIARSPHLGIWATCKYDKSVEIGDKLASLCLQSIGKAHECHKYGVFVGHAYRLQAMCYLLMRTSPKHYVGKDCQHTRILELAAPAACAGQCSKMQHARGVCALESSSIIILLQFEGFVSTGTAYACRQWVSWLR